MAVAILWPMSGQRGLLATSLGAVKGEVEPAVSYSTFYTSVTTLGATPEGLVDAIVSKALDPLKATARSLAGATMKPLAAALTRLPGVNCVDVVITATNMTTSATESITATIKST